MMLAPVLLVTLAASPDLGPMMPPGANTNFMNAAVAVEEKLQAGDFSSAAKLAELLPKRTIIVEYDDSKVPDNLKPDFVAQRDAAFDTFRNVTKATIKLGHVHPDVKFSFEPVLPNPPDSGIPAGTVNFWSDSPGDVRLETVIGIKRGAPAEQINPVNVCNEIQAALGSYWGLAETPFPGSLMSHTDVNYQQAFTPNPTELLLCNECGDIAAELRTDIQKHKPVVPTHPKVFFQPKSVEMGHVFQGNPEGFEIQITNTGNAPLAMRFTPDCGCVSTTRYEVIQPSATFLLKGHYDTMLTVGEVHHTLLVQTNDSDNPVVTVPVHVSVNPRYRFLFPDGDVVQLPEGGRTITAYLVIPDGSDIEPKAAQVGGAPGVVTFEPWKGDLADPVMNEPVMPRKGYKMNIKLSGEMPAPGRDSVTLWVQTNDEQFPSIQSNFFVQRGVIVLPAQLFMGEVGQAQQKFSLVVTGPAKSFHVKKVTSDWPYLKFSYYSNPEGTEYHIDATYTGGAPVGPVLGTVNVETDDPQHPVLTVPINATVK